MMLSGEIFDAPVAQGADAAINTATIALQFEAPDLVSRAWPPSTMPMK
jgi:hypothetical protein